MVVRALSLLCSSRLSSWHSGIYSFEFLLKHDDDSETFLTQFLERTGLNERYSYLLRTPLKDEDEESYDLLHALNGLLSQRSYGMGYLLALRTVIERIREK